MPTAIDLFEKTRRHERLEQLQAARDHDLLPYFRVLEGPAGPVVRMEGADRIMLGSNNYLGLTGDQRVKDAAREALDRFGTGLTGSRFLNGTVSLHLELERELADWMGTDDALVFTTGYLANTGCIGTLLSPSDTVICDSGDHASILDAVSMSRARIRPFRHNRLDKLESMLERAEGDGGGVLVVVDGVFSMEGDVAPLPEIVALCRRHRGRREHEGARLNAEEVDDLRRAGDEAAARRQR
ncbi:MAG TPA: pyridoxal phosphate-dependent aminotransferase family protein, partial [Thermoleophilaceae bacterium]|nr:pyridoxal phosphate-dependent aminotransferase family protein [Thermoleophilaceae bacterium]